MSPEGQKLLGSSAPSSQSQPCGRHLHWTHWELAGQEEFGSSAAGSHLHPGGNWGAQPAEVRDSDGFAMHTWNTYKDTNLIQCYCYYFKKMWSSLCLSKISLLYLTKHLCLLSSCFKLGEDWLQISCELNFPGGWWGWLD